MFGRHRSFRIKSILPTSFGRLFQNHRSDGRNSDDFCHPPFSFTIHPIHLGMLAVASKRFATLSSVLRTCSTFRGFAEAVNSDEFEIVKNMSTYPLFSEKVQVCIVCVNHVLVSRK